MNKKIEFPVLFDGNYWKNLAHCAARYSKSESEMLEYMDSNYEVLDPNSNYPFEPEVK